MVGVHLLGQGQGRKFSEPVSIEENLQFCLWLAIMLTSFSLYFVGYGDRGY